MNSKLFWTVVRAIGGLFVSAAAVAAAYISHKEHKAYKR